MRTLATLVVLAVALTASHAQSVRDYTWEEVRQNLGTRQDVTELVDCVLGTRQAGLNCRPMFLELRRILPEAVRENCVQCTQKQIQTLNQARAYLQRFHRDEYVRLSRGIIRS